MNRKKRGLEGSASCEICGIRTIRLRKPRAAFRVQGLRRGVEPFFPSPHTTHQTGSGVIRIEEGEDLRLLDFKTIEYERTGFALATDEQLARIAEVPKREFIRRGINQHTLQKICGTEPVRVSRLAKVLTVLEEFFCEILTDGKADNAVRKT